MKRLQCILTLGLAVAVLAPGVMASETQPLTKPPKGGGWISLFDGKSLDGWHYKVEPNDDNRKSWAVLNGVLINYPPEVEGQHGIDLVSDVKLGDHELYIEFNVLGGSNSGVYLMGDYEIQVLDSYGNDRPAKHDCGGIYDKIAPSVNASRPAGNWQTYHAIFHAPKVENGRMATKPRVTVYHNGKKVIDDQEIDGLTGAALSGRRPAETGPTYLQGNHGAVMFRNIYYKPIK